MLRRPFPTAIGALVALMIGAGVLAFTTTGEPSPRSTSRAEFVVECTWSHRAQDDPIVHPGQPGAAHMHDFFGSTATDASSTASSLLGTDSTCQTNAADTAAYWVPTLYRGDDPVEPGRLFAYYRRPALVGDSLGIVSPYPLGLVMVAGDMDASVPQSTEVVAWHCGASPVLSERPGRCTRDAPLALRVAFPSCWDGVDLDSADHRSHVVYASGDGCPSDHAVLLPELIIDVEFDFVGDPAGLRLASGGVLTGHADFLDAWDPTGLEALIRTCLGRGEGCGIAPTRSTGTAAEPPTSGD